MTAPIAIKAYDKPHSCIGRPIMEVVRIAHANLARVVQTASDEQRKYTYPVAKADWTLRCRTIKGIVVKVGES